MRLKMQWLYNLFFSLKRSNDLDAAAGPIFIVGTGRSGTHFLCSCLNEFAGLSDAFDGKESPYMFHEVSNITVRNESLPQYVINYYKHMQSKLSPKIFVDQTHPNLWHAEQLMECFPNAKFIAISREVYSVVHSMKLHPGVSKWIKNYEKYPKPNPFLGINDRNSVLYSEKITDLQRAVFRWCSHEARIKELLQQHPERVMRIKYEDLHTDMRGVMDVIAAFVGVEPPELLKSFKEKSLSKKNGFTDEEMRQIDEALSLYRSLDG